jgi:poly(3-hydroxybutyrate) depolymerase
LSALSRAEVDPKRVAIQGISQGGYWVPRAVAFEKRIAAAIADPGVVDVSTSWTASLPKPMLDHVNSIACWLRPKSWCHLPKAMEQIFIASQKGPGCAISGYSIGSMRHWDENCDAVSILPFHRRSIGLHRYLRVYVKDLLSQLVNDVSNRTGSAPTVG